MIAILLLLISTETAGAKDVWTSSRAGSGVMSESYARTETYKKIDDVERIDVITTYKTRSGKTGVLRPRYFFYTSNRVIMFSTIDLQSDKALETYKEVRHSEHAQKVYKVIQDYCYKTPNNGKDIYFWTSYDEQGEVDAYVMTETIVSSDRQYGFSVYIKDVMRNERRIKYKNLAIFFWDNNKSTWKVNFPDAQRGGVVEVNRIPYVKKIFEICYPIWQDKIN